MRLSVPSKTFVVGEYLALEGGPSLVVSTGPRFEFIVSEKNQGACQGLHPSSPAGRLMRDHSYKFQEVATEFIDPHKAQGGFGASGAQFIFTYVWSKFFDRKLNSIEFDLSLKEMWQVFRQYAWDGQGLMPSGADIVSQFTGGLVCYEGSSFKVEKKQWLFEGKKFFILRTGNKIETHKHLNTLKTINVNLLKPRAEAVIDAVDTSNWQKFTVAIAEYYEALVSEKLVCIESQELVKELKKCQSIEALKSCGAMGADTILVFFDEKNTKEVREHCEQLKLEIVGSEIEEVGLKLELEFVDNKAQKKKLLLSPENTGELNV